MRSIGSSFFISVCVTEIVRTTSANYSRLMENITPYNKHLIEPSTMGAWTTDTVSGMTAIAREVTRQAALIGYMNAFVLYTCASAIAIPLVLMLGGRAKKA